MKACRQCKQVNVRESNGIAVSKYCVGCREEKKKEKKEKHKTTKVWQKKEKKRLHGIAWKLTSEIVRRERADEWGMVSCYSCGKRMRWKDAHCGHFHHGKLDFDFRNLKPQGDECNTYKHGNLAAYATHLAQEYGAEWLQQLALDANTHKGYSVEELERIIEEYTLKLSDLEKRFI